VRNFAELGALCAISDVVPSVAAAAADRFGVPARRVEELIADSEVEAIVIATPAATHAALAASALEAGKHVFVEKPLALAVKDAEELCELADRSGRILMVGHLLNYHPAFLALDEMVKAGVLGRLQYVYSNRLNFGRFRREEDILWSFAPHDLSMILRLIGSEPDSVQAVASRHLHKTIADVTTTHLTFPGGESAHVHVSWLHPIKEQRLVVIGDRGMAVFDDGQPWESKLTRFPHQVEWLQGAPVPVPAEGEPLPLEQREPLAVECEHFLTAVEAGTPVVTDGREGLRVLRVLDLARASIGGQGTSGSSPVHPTATIDEGVVIGADTKVWHHAHVLSGSTIGAGCVLGKNVMVGPGVAIGDGCRIQNNVSVYEGVTLEDDVFCGPSMVFTNVRNPRAGVDRRREFEATLVKRGATIGANATVLCGTTLGDYCMVGAGAVVLEDVPAHALVVGNPARQIGWVSRSGDRLGEDLVCPRTGETYRQTGSGLTIDG
jgi:UDP-2-acetamido-3-amino-2,3-dideoxy-glucuronate N-acetyltransferase